MYKFCFFLLLFLMLIFSGFAQKNERHEYIQESLLQREIYEDWWENNTLQAVGYGAPNKNKGNSGVAKAFARRAAIMDAYGNLAKQAGAVRITKDKNLLRSEVDVLLKGAEIISEEYDELGNCTVVMRIPIYGITNSVAKVAFKPVAKENFLSPSEDVKTEGNYTGLIIDCGDEELNPVLSPVIRNENNQSIYSYSNLDYDKVISKGMIDYKRKTNVNADPQSQDMILLLSAEELKKKFIQNGSNLLVDNEYGNNISRAGSNPLVIKAVNMGDDNTCPIISAEDSDKILAENGLSHFLDDGAVVFTSNRIRGMRL